MSETVKLSINGQEYEATIDLDTPLLYVLRNDCGLVSPKYGCGAEQCGACKVLVDGDAVPTCKLPVGDVLGSEIVTLEGLSTDGQLHPLQDSFIEMQAAQCGFCSSGMLTAAVDLCQKTPQPSDTEIREAMERHLCRCGVYDRVRRAIRATFEDSVSKNYEAIEMPLLANDTPKHSELPRSIQNYPDLDSWVQIGDSGEITIFSGKVELGQGIKTALAQIAARELGVYLEKIEVVTGDTERSPNEGGTTGSMSVEMSGSAIQFASATARDLLLAMAFEELEAETPATDLTIENGIITDPATGRKTSYQQLMGGRSFGHVMTRQVARPSAGIVGQASQRLDLPAKVTGQAAYVHDMALPDMLHARVVRPPNYHARLDSIDIDAIRDLPGVIEVIRDGSFVSIVAKEEAQVVSALEKASGFVRWSQIETLPEQKSLYENLQSSEATSHLIVDGAGVDDALPEIETPANASVTLQAKYRRPYHMHGSLGTSAAVAVWQDEQLTVWSHSQSVFTLRDSLAEVLGLDASQIRVIHREGAGCYGHNGADDVALDAALVAMAMPGQPISMKWTREQEHAWEPYGSAMAMDMQASLDDAGNIISWNHDVWSYGHSTRPRPGGDVSGLLASWHLEKPFKQQEPRPITGYHFGAHRNADPIYDFPEKRIVRHEVGHSPVRVSALRSLGAYANVFAIETFMNELAYAADIDPLEFRLKHLTDERASAVLETVANKSNWHSRKDSQEQGIGWGIAFAQYKNKQCYAAVIVKVRVDSATGHIRVDEGYIAADAGRIINPDGLSNQLEGGFVQAISWTLHEQVTYDVDGITSRDWDSYPILRFPDAPVVEVTLLDRPDQPSLGAGEATQNPTPAATASAIFDATGVWMRDIPFTAEKLLSLQDNSS